MLPDKYSDDLLARLDRYDEQAEAYVASKRPGSTTRGYEQDWAEWTHFCIEFGIPLTAVRTGTLVLFVEWLWQRPAKTDRNTGEVLRYTAPSTVDRRLSGTVVEARRRYRLPLPKDIAAPARELLKRKKKELADAGEERGTGKAPALLVPHLQGISAALPDNLYGLRNRSLVTLHFCCAAREHEMAHLLQRDITVVEQGLLVNIRVSKIRPREVAVPYAQRLSICPVRAWLTYQAEGAVDDPDAPAFPRLTSNRRPTGEALTPEGVGNVLTACGLLANLGIRMTGHSPRRGFANEARRAGADRKGIAAQGGWTENSAVMEGYFDEVDRWEENPLLGLM